MQFVVIAKDYPDALERRMACRPDHIHMADGFKEQGKFLHAGALLNDEGQMIGSIMICEFDSLEAMQEEWMSKEPYILGKVWETTEIMPYRVGPSFATKPA